MAETQHETAAAPAVARDAAPPTALPGWTGAAMAVHAVRRMPTAMIVSLQPDGFEPMLVDMRAYVYRWSEPLDRFPPAPSTVRIGTQAIRDAEPAFAGDDFVEHPPAFAGAPLEPLLWLIGTHAFDGGRASWLRSGDRYRLYRWPDIGLLPMSDEQRRIVKASAAGFMVVEKLAERAKVEVEVEAAQRVVNALSLMGLLRRHAAANAAPDAPPPPPAGVIPGD
ncbi:hypothetical protein [Microcella sp.]|uniref:hypothetical protein n=1 Tax=Microcella sp. TaxID=1913979 RepID=UPI003F70B09C